MNTKIFLNEKRVEESRRFGEIIESQRSLQKYCGIAPKKSKKPKIGIFNLKDGEKLLAKKKKFILPLEKDNRIPQSAENTAITESACSYPAQRCINISKKNFQRLKKKALNKINLNELNSTEENVHIGRHLIRGFGRINTMGILNKKRKF